MPQFINTNIASLNAQRNLESSSMNLNKSIERLSSGLRINSASDDAAGMAIASRMTAQVRGMEQASRNTNDAISLVQTAEGAMGEQIEMLQRIRELSVQSSNGILSDSDRTKLDNEAQALISEIDRVAKTTSFNGVNLLDGLSSVSDGTGADFQIGSNAGETLKVETSNTTKVGLNLNSHNSTGAGVANADTTAAAANGHTIVITSDIGGSSAATTITIDAEAGRSVADKLEASINAINEKTTTTGVVALATGSGVELRTATGVTATLTLDGATTDLDEIGVVDATAGAGAMDNVETALSLTSQESAKTAILQIDAALDAIQSSRSDMGTYQNRFEATVSNLSQSSQQLSSSRSRIEDADFANETAKMTRNQIMSQAGVSMLSQANALPQNVLSLLR